VRIKFVEKLPLKKPNTLKGGNQAGGKNFFRLQGDPDGSVWGS